MRHEIHRYTKTTVVRTVTRVFDDGEVRSYVVVDSEEPTRDNVIAVLERAKLFVAMEDGGELHDKLPDPLPEIEIHSYDEEEEE